jgi:hypothetical protein
MTRPRDRVLEEATQLPRILPQLRFGDERCRFLRAARSGCAAPAGPGGADRHPADAELLGELAFRRQALAVGELTARDSIGQLLLDLQVRRALRLSGAGRDGRSNR